MSNRWDVMSIREYTDRTGVQRTNWTKVGAGFTNQNGSINIILEMIPCAVDGEVKLQLQVPLTKEEKEAKFGSHGQAMRNDAAPNGNRGAQPAPGRGFAPPRQQGAPQPQGRQQQGNAQRYGSRGQSAPKQQQFGPPPAYVPDPNQRPNPAGYEEHAPKGPPWTYEAQADDGLTYEYTTSDPSQLPPNHPDHVPF